MYFDFKQLGEEAWQLIGKINKLLFLINIAVFIILLLFSLNTYAVGKEVLIETPNESKDKIIYGSDVYGLDSYEGLDMTSQPQMQQEDAAEVPSLENQWNLENNDFDSYQEIQSRRLIEAQKRSGKLPLKYY